MTFYGNTHRYNVDQAQIPAAGGVATTIGDLNTFLKLHLNPPSWLSDLDQIYAPIIASGGVNGNQYGVGTAIFNVLGTNVCGHLAYFSRVFQPPYYMTLKIK